MYEEPVPMREIHEIRERLYEECKSLSHKEHIAKIHKEAEEAIKKYNIKLQQSSRMTG